MAEHARVYVCMYLFVNAHGGRKELWLSMVECMCVCTCAWMLMVGKEGAVAEHGRVYVCMHLCVNAHVCGVYARGYVRGALAAKGVAQPWTALPPS